MSNVQDDKRNKLCETQAILILKINENYNNSNMSKNQFYQYYKSLFTIIDKVTELCEKTEIDSGLTDEDRRIEDGSNDCIYTYYCKNRSLLA